MATQAPPATPAAGSSPSPAQPSPAPSPSPGDGAGSSAPRTEAEFLAGVPGPVDSLFGGEEGGEGSEPEGGEPADPQSPDAIFDQIEQGLSPEARAAFKQRLDALKTEAGRVRALAEERRALASTAQHNTQAGQGWMQLFGLAVQQLRAAGQDTSQLEQYAGGQVPQGQAPGGAADDDGGGGDFDYIATAREAIQSGLSDTYWQQYNTAMDGSEREMRAAQDLVEAQHPDGPAALKDAIAKRRMIDQIHSRRVAATAAHPAKAVYEALSRRLAALEQGQGQEGEAQQFVAHVQSALREHAHAVDELGKPIWREGGKFPFLTADGKALAPMGQKMIQPMAEFWDEYGLDPAEPKHFARAFHAIAGEMGLSPQTQAAPQEAAGGRRGGGDPTLPGGASIPVAAVGRSPFQSPESRRQAILEANRRNMRAG